MKDDAIRAVIEIDDAGKRKRNERTVRDGFWPKFRAFAARIPFAEEVVAAYYCALDSDTPFKVRATLFAALAYFIFPLDFLPDMLLLVGLTDDIAVLTYAIATVRSEITEEHRAQARAALADEDVVGV